MPSAGDVLFKLDLRVDVDVTNLAVEGFVLQAGALQCGAAAILKLASRSRVGLDWPSATPSLQHRLVLRTCIMGLQLRQRIDSNFTQRAV